MDNVCQEKQKKRTGETKVFTGPGTRENLIEQVKGFPDRPGVYLMHDAAEKIIYVGKAKSLKKRVMSYFRHSGPQNGFASPRLRKLVSTIADITTIRTDTEAEALILEARLIKLYQPFFNVELKMGDRYPYIKITNEPFPRLVVTRHKAKDGATYLGPYVSAYSLRELLRLAERYFPLRHCAAPIGTPAFRRLPRPCMKYSLGRCLGPCHDHCTENEYRERVADVALLLQGNSEELTDRLYKRMTKAAHELAFEEAARLRDVLYAMRRLSHQQSLLPGDTPDVGGPERNDPWQPLLRLKEVLHLPTLPWRIDGFDISHTAGGETVGVVVVFEQGLANVSRYRRFNIKTVEGVDDFRSINETLKRRYAKSLDGQEPLPQLILIDGGEEQLKFAKDALEDLKLEDIPIVALAKRYEEIYIPGMDVPLRLEPNDMALRLLMRVRDEAHRFAISAHRRRREGALLHNKLEDIPGVGRKRAVQLLSRFGSARDIAQLDEEVLASVPRIGRALARRILEALKEEPV